MGELGTSGRLRGLLGLWPPHAQSQTLPPAASAVGVGKLRSLLMLLFEDWFVVPPLTLGEPTNTRDWAARQPSHTRVGSRRISARDASQVRHHPRQHKHDASIDSHQHQHHTGNQPSSDCQGRSATRNTELPKCPAGAGTRRSLSSPTTTASTTIDVPPTPATSTVLEAHADTASPLRTATNAASLPHSDDASQSPHRKGAAPCPGMPASPSTAQETRQSVSGVDAMDALAPARRACAQSDAADNTPSAKLCDTPEDFGKSDATKPVVIDAPPTDTAGADAAVSAGARMSTASTRVTMEADWKEAAGAAVRPQVATAPDTAGAAITAMEERTVEAMAAVATEATAEATVEAAAEATAAATAEVRTEETASARWDGVRAAYSERCFVRPCSLCGGAISGHTFMLHDQPYCTSECRLKACRLRAARERAGMDGGKVLAAPPTAIAADAASVRRSRSALSKSEAFSGVDLTATPANASSSGLYASFSSWM